MDDRRFTSTAFGRIIQAPGGGFPYDAFEPAPLPRSLALAADVVVALSEADRALGRLAGAGRLLPNPHLLIGPYMLREAVSSSRIEGTQASLSDVLEARSGGPESPDVAEVLNYVRALQFGLARLNDLPVCVRLLCEVHEHLLRGVRGESRLPGEVRRSQNWIGEGSVALADAIFVPPPVEQMRAALDDLERFLNEAPPLPPLIRCGLAHYQFETIHPFLDGNGRLGRLLMVFLMTEWGLLPQPLLYLSAYFETRRAEYYNRLQAVRERGEIDQWLSFFLDGVTTQASDALLRAERLGDLREGYHARLAGGRSRGREVVDLAFESPVVTSAMVVERLSITAAGAVKLLGRLEGEGILREIERLPGRSRRWVASEILETLDRAAPEGSP